METMRKSSVGAQVFDVQIKRDMEWLAGDSHAPDLANQELELNKELLRAIKTEEDPYHTDAEVHAAKGFTSISQTDEYIKTELVLDAEFVDNINDSEAKCKPSLTLADAPLIIAEISDKKNQNIERRKRRPKFCCELCEKKFRTKTGLKYHMRTHTGETIDCEVCGRGFMREESLKRHMLLQHTTGPRAKLNCELCEKRFYSTNGLIYHMKKHTGETFGCEVCGARYTQRYSLKTHMLRKHPDIKQQLTLDPQTNAYPQTADDDSEEETFSCEICLRSCNTQFTLKRHLKTHSKDRERKFACDLCEKKFHAKHSLRYHRKSHNTPQTSNDDAIPTNTGPISDEEFRHEENGDSVSHAEGSRRHHMLQKHPIGPRPKFNCELCEKNFFTKNGLKYHMTTHTGETFGCEVCEARFTRRHSLKNHMIHKHTAKMQQLIPEPQTNACLQKESLQLTPDPQAANDSVYIKEEYISDEEFLDEEMP